MSIPPTGRPSGTPSEGDKSEGPDRGRKPDREFALPQRRSGERESDEQQSPLEEFEYSAERRNPNQPDRRHVDRGAPQRRSGGQQQQPTPMKNQQQQRPGVQKKQQQQQGGGGGTGPQQGVKGTGAEKSVEETSKVESKALLAKAETEKIGKLILKMVDTMQIGKLGGQDFASLNLKATTDVPIAFQGSNLTLSFEKNGLVIKFDNFMTPQQEQDALKLVETNKEQLDSMLRTLEAKNIQVQALNIGNNQVTLPSQLREANPLNVPPTPPGEQPVQRDRGEGERQGQQEAEEDEGVEPG